jgi:hypothetical protein
MKTILGRVSLLLLTATLAKTALAQEAQISETARQHFKTGVAYLTDPDGARYEDAYREFKAAYAASPSWKILGNLGITSMKLERDGEAVEAFEKYLQGGGANIDPAERAQMERDLMTTKSGLVWVTVKADPPNANVVDERTPLSGRPIVNRYELAADGAIKVGIRRGHHKMTAKLDGYADNVWEFDAEPGAEQTHEFKLERPKVVAPPPGGEVPGGAGGGGGPAPVAMERPIPTGVIILGVATGGLLIGSGVVGLMAMSKKSAYNEKNDGAHVAEAESLRDSGKTLNLVGDVLLGAGVVAGVVTTILFVGRPEVPASGPPAATGKLHLVPAVAPTGAGVFVDGRF